MVSNTVTDTEIFELQLPMPSQNNCRATVGGMKDPDVTPGDPWILSRGQYTLQLCTLRGFWNPLSEMLYCSLNIKVIR